MKKQVKQVSTSLEQSNITLADVGHLYTTDGKEVWTLAEFKPEPQVSMRNISKDIAKQGNLSEFKDFIRLLPEQEFKKPRKTRSDAGLHRIPVPDSLDTAEPLIGASTPPETLRPVIDPDSLHIIDYLKPESEALKLVIDMASPDNPYNVVTIGSSHAKSKDLKKAVINALVHYDGKIPDGLSGKDKKQLESILKAP